jgi:pectinesterase
VRVDGSVARAASTGAASSPAPHASSPAATGQGDRLVVDADGGGYDAIGPAVADADPGDVVVVRPGTYRPTVTVDESIAIVAPDGATLDGTGLGRDAPAFTIPPGSDAAPTIAGFAAVDYGAALLATESAGDWTLRDAAVRDVGARGVYAARTSGAWTVRNARFVRVDRGIDAHDSRGDWTVARVTVRNVTKAIDAEGASGDWRVRRTRLAGVDSADGEFGRGSTVFAANATGDWAVTRSSLVDGDPDEPTIDAVGANPAGKATRNWWGSTDGPESDDCVGAVDCGDPLPERPDVGAGPSAGIEDPAATVDDPAGNGTGSTTGTPTPSSTPRPTTVSTGSTDSPNATDATARTGSTDLSGSSGGVPQSPAMAVLALLLVGGAVALRARRR